MPPTPKGTIVTPVPRWNARNMMFGSGVLSISTADNFQSLRLVNNDLQGGYIAVWDVRIDMDPAASWKPNEVNVFLAFGPNNLGVATGAFQPLSPAFPQQPGQIVPVLNDPAEDQYPYQPLAHPGAWQWNHDWPLFYIQPGQYFGVLFTGNLSTGIGNVSASFYWESNIKTV